MYTREEVAEEGLLWGQVHCSPLGHADSQPYPSEEIVHQFFKEVFLKTKNTENVEKLSEGLGKTIFDMLIVKVVAKQP